MSTIWRKIGKVPKDGQEFIGKTGAIISGAIVLTKWQLDDSSKHWVADNLPAQLKPFGQCVDGAELCRFREDLFVQGKLFERVGSKEELGPGKWYNESGKAYLLENPSGKEVEISVSPVAFSGRAKDVVLKNLVVEKFASAAQFGAIDARHSVGWKIVDVIVRWNHGIGIYMGPKMQIIRGAALHNGQLGIGGKGDDGLLDGVEIAFNNYAKFSATWEAGGTKFANTTNLTVRNTCVHHNDGPGLWTDINNVNTVYERNKVFRNGNDGIKHEISYKATIRNNIVAENGLAFDTWLWGSQILIQNSQDVEVYGNTVVVSATRGHGISIVNQERGSGNLGPYIARNNRVMDNTIIHLGERGINGIATDVDGETFWKSSFNKFNRNTYFGMQPNKPFWALNGGVRSWDYVRTHGMERAGTLARARKRWDDLSCK